MGPQGTWCLAVTLRVWFLQEKRTNDKKNEEAGSVEEMKVITEILEGHTFDSDTEV